MDIIDNLVYASFASALQPVTLQSYTAANPRIRSNFIPPFPPNPGTLVPDNVGTATAPVFYYTVDEKISFCAYEDPDVIEDAMLRHWYDVHARVNYDRAGVTPTATVTPVIDRFSSFAKSSTYHLIFAYLVENTRILQIFERMIEKYLHDEDFGIADDPIAFNWIQNAERLFFKNDSLGSSNVRSLIRPSADATRRNAYWRMFGMDLAFGDINSSNGQLPYIKAKTSNQQFIPLFEKYLSEIWQSFINANNSSGVNTADINIVVDLATQLRELLIARRGNVGSTTSYANLNLSREEFSAVLITTWFTIAVSEDSSVVQFLKCQSSTIGERLIKIGNKVGIPAHNRSQTLFEMAGAAANILRIIEEKGVFDDPARMPLIFKSITTPGASEEDKNFMSDFLTVINNWEKATGHKIKNTDANITAKVKVQQSGVKLQPTMN